MMWLRFSIGEAAVRPAARRALARMEKYITDYEGVIVYGRLSNELYGISQEGEARKAQGGHHSTI